MQTNSLEADKFDTHMGLVLFEAYFVESARGFAPDSQNGFTFDRF